MKCEFSKEELFVLAVSVSDREKIAKNFIPINNVDRKLITQALTGLAALRAKLDTLIQQAESTHPLVQEIEAQYDLRQELLRFCRFIKAQGYILTTQNFLAHVAGEHLAALNEGFLEDLVEQALQADETDWFSRAQHVGYAQDGGHADLREHIRLVQHTCGCLLLQSVYGTVTCWYGYRDAETGPSSPLVTTCPHCPRTLEDADMSPVNNLTASFAQDSVIQEVMRPNEADALIADACYLLNMEVDGDLSEDDFKGWRKRWLSAAEDYLKSIGGAP